MIDFEVLASPPRQLTILSVGPYKIKELAEI